MHISGLPLLVVGLWSFLTSYLQSELSDSNMDFTGFIYERDRFNSSMHDFNLEPSSLDELPMTGNQTVICPFLVDHDMPSEWAYKGPMLLILACNMVFLVYIMTVSIVP